MLLGHNHNIVHKGITFHIQTEDSGMDNPYIVTHLFIGGNILATKKTSYQDIIKIDGLEKIVNDLMKDQHKKMIIELRDGVYDSHEMIKSQLNNNKAAAAEPKQSSEKIQRVEENTINIDETKNLDEVILDYLVETAEEK
ncbi:MAG: hypothetical protein M1381_04470 [Deltaproteobacteria bacterium]|nr:hypothetical protein [Deltaproteobacteria bacterium]MCL5791401.1 hypothetical protein [Deltaproteobacteria bacterium]